MYKFSKPKLIVSKIDLLVSKIHPIFWQLFLLGLPMTFFCLVLINRSPNLIRPLSMSLRTGFGLVIPFVTLIVYLALRTPGRIGEIFSLSIVMSLFAMPLAGLWASGQSQSTVINGLIPLYDAESYYTDALGLINGYKFSTFSARRPLFPSLLAVLLYWTGNNLMVSLAMLTALVGLVCFFSAKEIQRTHGTEIATFILIILFLFFRAHSGISMSENLGFALGTLGFILLWQGSINKNLIYLWAGIFTTTLALNARAGAFFILPLLLVWIGWLHVKNKKNMWKPIIIGSTAIVLGFFINLIITRLIAVPSGVPFANFSYTLYGLASGGKSWAYIFTAYPEIALMAEPEKTKQIYLLAIELIRTRPFQLIQGALFNWKMLFSNSWYNIYSYVGGENPAITLITHWGLYLLSLIGIYAWYKDRNDPIKSLILISYLGVFISVPFLPPTDAYRMRPYAASIIILASLPALGFWYLCKKFQRNSDNGVQPSNLAVPYPASIIMSALLILVTFFGPVIYAIKSISPTSLKPLACTVENHDLVLVHFDQGTYINIEKEDRFFLDWMPNYHAGQFKEKAHSLPDGALIDWAESLEPPVILFYSLDFNTMQKVLVSYKTDVVPETGKYYQFCGIFETSNELNSYRIFYANEALLLPP